ncbi:hypothetical protein V3C99_001466 [Haemonchus contortus]|uniref:Uncharacterized protein n=1 Tax=Haemonchus contortus TaxID=6289 RepID=A0A7I4YEI5_HAECO
MVVGIGSQERRHHQGAPHKEVESTPWQGEVDRLRRRSLVHFSEATAAYTPQLLVIVLPRRVSARRDILEEIATRVKESAAKVAAREATQKDDQYECFGKPTCYFSDNSIF